MVEYLADKLGLDPHNDIFLPHRDAGDAGVNTMHDVFSADVGAIANANVMIAWLDGMNVDAGTAVEIGIAYSSGKPVIGLLTDRRFWSGEMVGSINNMIRYGCAIIVKTIDDACDELTKLNKPIHHHDPIYRH